MNRTGRAGGCPVTVTGAVAVVAALLLGGCHDGSQPPPAAGVGGGDRDPGQVCGSFAADRARHDTTTDTGPDEAHQRARRWAHPELADNPPPAGRHRQWALWTAHRVVVDVAVQPWAGDGLPADTDQRAYRAVVVSATPVGGDGWTGPTTRHTVYCTLGRAGGRWLVTGYQVDGGG
jgi:hypothetical protein